MDRPTAHIPTYSIFAGFHTDLNFLTIHGKSRVRDATPACCSCDTQLTFAPTPVSTQYPGLHIWARNSGRRVAVKVPDGCLLVQAGKQIEWMTGGLIKGGLSAGSGGGEGSGADGACGDQRGITRWSARRGRWM